MKARILTIIFSCLLMVAGIPYTTQAFDLYDHEFSGEVITPDTPFEIDLGQINQGKEITISVMVQQSFTRSGEETVDVSLITDQAHSQGGAGITNASEGETTFAYYTWTTEFSDHFWLIIDNLIDEDVTITIGYVDIDDPYGNELKTRILLGSGTSFHHDFGTVSSGDKLDLNVNCEDWLNDDIDIFVVNEINRNKFLAGEDVWDRNASYLDACFEMWSFEVPSSGHWHVYLENGQRGEADPISEGVLIDLSFSSGSLLPSVIQDTTRMIEESDTWRVDLGSVSSGDVMSFSVSMDGLFNELDILIMTSSNADDYLAGQTATVLGHASLIDTDFFETWDYMFPDAGSYSLILDNTKSPSGGASGNSAIHVEINVQEVTLLGSWIGWYQSRHYVENAAFVSFDLGNLDVDDGLYYLVSGHSHDTSFTSFTNKFDVLLMDDDNYNLYTSGSNPSIIQDGSDLDTSMTYTNYTIATAGHYWVVIDTSDGPTDGADSNGAWTFDFTINSDKGGISCPQVKDSNYEMNANHPTDTDILDTNDNTNTGTNTNTNNNNGNTNNNDDNNVDDTSNNKDIGDAQSTSSSIDSGGMNMALGTCCLIIIALIVITRKRRRGGNVQIIKQQPMMQQQQQPMMQQQQQPMMQQQQQPMMQQQAPPSNWAQSWEQLPDGGNYDYSAGTRYIGPDGRIWVQQHDGSFRC